jgi:hypothetical protein
MNGLVAQLVEQRTENPCVGGSIPSQATILNVTGTLGVTPRKSLNYRQSDVVRIRAFCASLLLDVWISARPESLKI